jgi:serine protease inhibitor
MGKKKKDKEMVMSTIGEWVESQIEERVEQLSDKGIEINRVEVLPSNAIYEKGEDYEQWFKIVYKRKPS